MFQGKVKILSNNKISGRYFKMKLGAEEIARSALAGQFIEVRVTDKYEPLLRRPFSIHRVMGSKIVILYEAVGKGTQILSQKNPGQYLDIIGPLGNGFNYRSSSAVPRTPILVAGGMGVAPLVFLAERLAHSVERIAYRKNKRVKLSASAGGGSAFGGKCCPCLAGRQALNAIVLIGARTKSQLSCEKEFKQLGFSVKIATDDGSGGFKGRVTELLEKVLATCYRLQATGKNKKQLGACGLQPAAIVYACGPGPMLAEVGRIAGRYRIPAQVSLEAFMACGIGACLGCVVPAQNGYKRVCKDGPVFNAREILWQKK